MNDRIRSAASAPRHVLFALHDETVALRATGAHRCAIISLPLTGSVPSQEVAA